VPPERCDGCPRGAVVAVYSLLHRAQLILCEKCHDAHCGALARSGWVFIPMTSRNFTLAFFALASELDNALRELVRGLIQLENGEKR
jgi:hypothetical protein